MSSPLPEALTLGLLGSVHCLGMCGVFAGAVGAGTRGRSRRLLAGRMAAYLGGKTLTYAFLGTLVFSAGARLLQGEALGTARRTALLLAGLAIVGTGLHLGGWLPAAMVRVGQAPGRNLARLLAPVRTWTRLPGPAGAAVLGFLNGFLPCGLVLAAVFLAAASATALGAATTMAVFGLATGPALLLPALAGRGLSVAGRPGLRRLAALLLLALAPFSLWRGGLLAGGEGTPSCCEAPAAASTATAGPGHDLPTPSGETSPATR